MHKATQKSLVLPAMELIALHYLTEEAYFREMARLYWQTDKKNKFVYNVAELALRYNVRPGKLLNYVRESAEAYVKSTRCALCGKPTHYLERRADFYDLVRSQKWKLWSGEVQHFCDGCQDVIDKRHTQKKITKPKISLAKSVFPTPAHLDLFRSLKQAYFFIYPSVAFPVFLPERAARAYFSAPWHEACFQRSVADFLVCDKQGTPEKVILVSTSTAPDANTRQEQRFRVQLLQEHFGLQTERRTLSTDSL